MGEHFVVKHGSLTDPLEAESMLFVRIHTGIRTPRLYAAYQSADRKSLYIVMEFIPGNTLESEWPSMSEQQKRMVCKRLRYYLDELRKLPSPGYFGAVGHQHLPDGIFWSLDPDAELVRAISGPFDSEQEFNNTFVLKCRLVHRNDERRGHKADFYAKSLPQVFKGNRPTFTHADFQRKNVIVKKRDQTLAFENEDDYEVTLIDWEKSGWYPDYWEYTIAAFAFRFDDDWPDKTGDILDPRLVEYPWVHMIVEDLWS